jgi:hypothetical protein
MHTMYTVAQPHPKRMLVPQQHPVDLQTVVTTVLTVVFV